MTDNYATEEEVSTAAPRPTSSLTSTSMNYEMSRMQRVDSNTGDKNQ